MEMLDASKENDVEVSAEDQDRINKFSRLNQRYDEIGSELEELSKQVEDLEEMETELELVDEDEKVMYKIDMTFVHLSAERALSTLQSSLSKIKEKNEALTKERQECNESMDELKKVLYAKFGDTINLERGD